MQKEQTIIFSRTWVIGCPTTHAMSDPEQLAVPGISHRKGPFPIKKGGLDHEHKPPQLPKTPEGYSSERSSGQTGRSLGSSDTEEFVCHCAECTDPLNLHPAYQLDLKAESSNPHDSFAVEIYLGNIKLGGVDHRFRRFGKNPRKMEAL